VTIQPASLDEASTPPAAPAAAPSPAPTPSRPSSNAASGYRFDLDGLRGVAIALVVVFHVWFGRVSGGVDIFLVLSGFFFTGMLVRRVGEFGGPSIPAIALRTAKRLLPALVLVLVAIATAILIQRPQTQWQDLGDQLKASLFYYQNWALAFDSADYAAASSSVSPMQHLWSMSVQGQFYLIILLIVAGVAAVCRRRKNIDIVRPALLALLTIGAIVSFVFAAAAEPGTEQAFAYYSTLPRLWELLAGAVLCLVIDQISLGLLARRVLAAIGAFLVLACGFLVNGSSEFPGPAALIPVGAAFALILAGVPDGQAADARNRPFVSNLLSTKPFQELGKLAYALYLWHWPLLIFFLYGAHKESASFFDGLLIIAVSLLLAWLTNRLVERPFTSREVLPAMPARIRLAVTPVFGLVVVVMLSGTVVWDRYLASEEEKALAAAVLAAEKAEEARQRELIEYPGARALLEGVRAPAVSALRPPLLKAKDDYPQPTVDGCIAEMGNSELITCEYGDTQAVRTIAVIGGSHAEHWVPALDILAKDRGVRLVTYLKMGCPVVIEPEDRDIDGNSAGCDEWSMEVLQRLEQDRPDWVFTTSTRPNPYDIGDITPDSYVRVWQYLSDRGLPLLALRDTPWLTRDGIPYLAPDCLSGGGTAESCGLPREEALSPENPALAAGEGMELVRQLDMSNAVCDVDICRAVEGNYIVYHDAHHLSKSYVETMAPELDRQIGLATAWW
jgi:peptidoglycan/LPS O-acetylase OafA/YrhL